MSKAHGSAYSHGRKCDCGAPVTNRAKSGQCRPCFMRRLASDPNRKIKAGETLRKRLQDPANHARHCAAARKGAATKAKNPEYRAKMARIMREVAQPMSVATGANMRGKDYSAMAKQAVEARWQWCPPEYRGLYTALREKVGKVEARKLLTEQILHDEARLSPFERQMKALQKGAKLVANDQAPSLANPGNYGEKKWG